MEGKLHRVELRQAEMYDLGNIEDITHHMLYDSGTRVVVDITAEVNQAPLLSRVTPYDLITDEGIGVLEKYLSGEVQPIKDWRKAGGVPCITGFKAEELVGDEYTPVRETMVALRDARKVLDDKIGEMRDYCLRANLVKVQEER